MRHCVVGDDGTSEAVNGWHGAAHSTLLPSSFSYISFRSSTTTQDLVFGLVAVCVCWAKDMCGRYCPLTARTYLCFRVETSATVVMARPLLTPLYLRIAHFRFSSNCFVVKPFRPPRGIHVGLNRVHGGAPGGGNGTPPEQSEGSTYWVGITIFNIRHYF